MLEQGEIRLVLTSGLARGQRDRALRVPRTATASKDVALRVADAAAAYRAGGRSAARDGIVEPHWVEDEHGRVELATIATYGENVHTFVNRAEYAGPYLPGYVALVAERAAPASGSGCSRSTTWSATSSSAGWTTGSSSTSACFGLTNMLHFSDEHISDRVLGADVEGDGGRRRARSSSRSTSRPRASARARSRSTSSSTTGPGVQHIALQSANIVGTVEALQGRGVVFLDTPEAYYDDVEDRVGEIDEDYDDLRRLRILADRDEDGYLLQIFTKTAQDRPTLFFEVIERHGATTFGEGNFKALFEAIEREQALRGNL